MHSFQEKKREGKNISLIIKASICIFGVFLFFGEQYVRAENNEIIITEIMFDSKSKSDDWIEIYNPTKSNIKISKDTFGIVDENKELSNLPTKNGGNKYANCHRVSDNFEIEPGDFYIITRDNNKFESVYGSSNSLTDSAFDLSSAGDIIRFSNDGCASFFYELEYEKEWGKRDGYSENTSLEKIDFSGKDKEDNWQRSYEIGGSPGKENSQKPPKKEQKEKLRINEILPNPAGADEGREYVEVYNYGKDEIFLEKISLVDRNGKTCPLSIFSKRIKPGGYLIVKIADKNNGDCKISIHNSAGKFSLYDEAFEGNIFEVEFLGSAKENVSYNFDGKIWKWSRFLTPGKENKFNNLPAVKIDIDEKVYQDMYANFELKAKDKDRDKLKFVWDFGDGHKSYLEKTRHKYEKAGKYLASVKVSDGSEEVVKNFTVNVQKYPRREVKIVELMPNPEGLDSENEWILVKNNSKKTVNLKGWSVATGISEKKLVNHPIYNSIKIKPGETEKITRKDSYFSLGNKQSYIELRYPDGKSAYSLKYKEKESIKDNSIFQKEKGKKWEWILQEVKGDDNEQISISDEQRETDNNQQTVGTDNQTAAGDNTTEGENTNSIYTGKTTQKPVEIEISPEIYKKLVENESNAIEFFGEFSIRQEEEKYFFTSKTALSEHYAKKFFEELVGKINIYLNKIFNA